MYDAFCARPHFPIRGLPRFSTQEAFFAPDRFRDQSNHERESFGGPEGRLIPLPGGLKGVSPLGAARSAGDQLRYLHEKRSPTRVFWRPSADLSPFQGDKRGCRPWGQREAQGINSGICTKKGHRRESFGGLRPTYPPSRGTKGGVAPGGSAKRGGLTQGSARKKVTDASR